MPFIKKLLSLAACTIDILEKFLQSVALLATRLYVGMEFWNSGTVKNAEGWDHAKSVFVDLFQSEWEKNHVKHWLGTDIPFPVPPGAFGTTYVEIALAVLLMMGLACRVADLGHDGRRQNIAGLFRPEQLPAYADQRVDITALNILQFRSRDAMFHRT